MDNTSKPATNATLQRLYKNMGDNLLESYSLTLKALDKLSALKLESEMIGTGEIETRPTKNILELYLSVLYVIMEISVVFRADFKSQDAGKRLNLKYIIFITNEFYKATFHCAKGTCLWDKVAEVLMLNNFITQSQLDDIRTKVQKYRGKYFSDEDLTHKEYRDMAIHYDMDVVKLYNHLKQISEEEEAKCVCDCLAIVAPLKSILDRYIWRNDRLEYTSKNEEQSELIWFDCIKESILPDIEARIPKMANSLHQIIQNYQYPENISDSLCLLFKDKGVRLKAELLEKREYGRLGILLHYFYLDILVSVSGYLQSLSYIEKRMNLVRLYVIMFEGIKKIIGPIGQRESTLWEFCIKVPLENSVKDGVQAEILSVENKLTEYFQDSKIDTIRNQYGHIRHRRKFNLPALFNTIDVLNPKDTLNEALEFIKLLNRIIRLNKLTIDEIK